MGIRTALTFRKFRCDMQRTLLKSKIHRATVTDANLHYEGSVTIDRRLMELADIVPFEQVHIYNVTNGNRLVTYAITGEPGSGTICINGAAAHLVSPGHLIIICAYGAVDSEKLCSFQPCVIHVDEANHPAPAPAAATTLPDGQH